MARDTILFDINETVLDLSSLKPKFEAAFGDVGVTATWFARLLQSSHVCAMTGVKTAFADLARIVLQATAQQRGVSLSEAQITGILGGFATMQPHADIVDALTLLKEAGYRVVAFSNSSLSLINTQMQNSGLDTIFDQVVSVESIGSFKPDPKVYQFAADEVGRGFADLRLVATHDWDVHGAMSVGMKGAFIQRLGSDYHPLYLKPDVNADDMRDVARQIIAADSQV